MNGSLVCIANYAMLNKINNGEYFSMEDVFM